ncbi:hypothetical protein ACEPPN_016314 [Leptodophora sp. 'Broadleaf-Isolate-01']
MGTFHPFPHLVIELRAQIWALAIEDRAVEVTPIKPPWNWVTTTPVPSITGASRESRECCSYKKRFTSSTGDRYIWVNFDHDIIHVRASLLWAIPMSEVKHLRIELVDDQGKEIEERWIDDYKEELRNFPKLVSVDLLVPEELRFYARYMEDNYFGTCLLKDVRIASIYTAEWIDEETWRQYWDYIESRGGTDLDCMTRLPDDDETYESRLEDMKNIQMPRPRINLDYLQPSVARTPRRV